MQIKHRFTDAVLYEDSNETMKETLEKAIQIDVDLKSANLEGANLKFANLRGANLSVKDPPADNYFWAELLKRAAKGDIEKLQFAGLVQLQKEWCWGDWKKIINKHFKHLQQWILSVDTWGAFHNKIL
jgi:hypothetical protein